jgi:hypothetical protein
MSSCGEPKSAVYCPTYLKGRVPIKIIRWTARALSALIIIFHAMSFLGDMPMANLSAGDRLKMTMWGLVLLGMVSAWKWEGAGGLLIVGVSLVQCSMNPDLLRAWPFWVAPVTGGLFLLCRVAERQKPGSGTKST